MKSFLLLSNILLLICLSAGVGAQNPGTAYFQDGDYLKAVEEFERQLAAKDSYSPELYYHLGRSYRALGDFTAALYQAASGWGAGHYQLSDWETLPGGIHYYFQGLCLLGNSDRNAALGAFRKAARLSRLPFAGYANAWSSALGGKAAPPGEHSLQLEYRVALLETGQPSPAPTAPEPLNGFHDRANAFILAAAAGDVSRAQQLLAELELPLLDTVEPGYSTRQKMAVEFHFYHPLVLKYLARFYYLKARQFLEALEKRNLAQPKQAAAVRHHLGLVYAALKAPEGKTLLARENDPYLQNYYAKRLWDDGDRASAEKIWRSNLSAGNPDAAAAAGYFLAVDAGITEAGLKACREAFHRAPRNQDTAALLAGLYLRQQQTDAAVTVLDASYRALEPNDPRYLLTYAGAMYAAGLMRDQDTMIALYLLQQKFPFAVQAHHYLQVLVTARNPFKEGGVGNGG